MEGCFRGGGAEASGLDAGVAILEAADSNLFKLIGENYLKNMLYYAMIICNCIQHVISLIF